MSEAQLQSDLEAVIAKHADWMDGRTWQRLAQLVACGHFAADDLMSFDEVMRIVRPPLRAVDPHTSFSQ